MNIAKMWTKYQRSADSKFLLLPPDLLLVHKLFNCAVLSNIVVVKPFSASNFGGLISKR